MFLEYAIAYMGDDTPPQTFVEAYEDAPASILTHSQREYFFGKRQITEGSERAMLRRIRQRIVAASWDMLLLVRTYPDNEIQKVSRDRGFRTSPFAGFLYATQPEDGLLTEDVTIGGDPTGRDRRAAWTENDVSRGIEQAIEYREGIDADVETTINVDRGGNLEALAEGDLSQLSRDQLDTLLFTDTITREEYAAANEERLEREMGGGAGE